MPVPPIPETIILHVETFPDALEVHWSRLLGEWLRKFGVLGVTVLGVAFCLGALREYARTSSWFFHVVICFLTLGMVLSTWRYLRLQAEGSGDALLRIECDRLLFCPGWWFQRREYLRTEVVSVATSGEFKVCLTVLAKNHPEYVPWNEPIEKDYLTFHVQFRTCGIVDRDWLVEVLKRWHVGTLFQTGEPHAPA